MATNKPKLTLEIGVPRKVKLLRNKPYNGTNSTGEYHLYSVADSDSGEEMAYFAPENIHKTIEDLKLRADAVIQLTRINGRVEMAVVGQAAQEPKHSDDGLKSIMLQCVKDSIEIGNEVKEAGFRVEDLRSLALSLFIARHKNGC